jgi:hypothetical protein
LSFLFDVFSAGVDDVETWVVSCEGRVQDSVTLDVEKDETAIGRIELVDVDGLFGLSAAGPVCCCVDRWVVFLN